MKSKILILFVLGFILYSCEKKEDKTVYVEEDTSVENIQSSEIEEPSVFDITFDIQIPHDDELQLFYTIDGDNDFREENSKKKKINGSSDFQEITFGLPQHATSIRLDVGKNQENQTIQIKDFTFSANGYQYDTNDLMNEFSTNEFVTLENNTFKTLTKNGKYDPFIVSKKSLNNQLQDSLR